MPRVQHWLPCLVCALFAPLSLAGTDSYPQAIYTCKITADKNRPERRQLTVTAQNRSKHIHIYGFRVDAQYMDCKARDSKPSKEFLKRACTVQSTAKMSIGSMAKPPRDDVHVPPGQTRSYQYFFRYPGNPSHKKYLYEHCLTYSTATFTAADAPRILGLAQQEQAEELPFWQRWWNKLKTLF